MATLHDWALTPQEAIAVQRRLAPLVERENRFGEIRYVAGIDVGFAPRNGHADLARAAVAVLSYPDLAVVEVSRAERPVTFPYVPGLLSFREAPAILAAYEQLNLDPDLLIFDGQGIAHRRRLGIASHVGLWLDKPSIGSAKSILVGRHGPLGEEMGSMAELIDRGEVVGVALRTKRAVSPVYVSIGHRVDLPTAAQLVLSCCRRYRLPEPQRQAHLAASSK
ncbi:MAG TPA: deoxyribonuclease V [Chloroflexota bacterium]|nr:deoxyribonuclease V [Chloroflexota bacterium]